MPAKKNLIGNKYGLLTVKSETNQRKRNSVFNGIKSLDAMKNFNKTKEHDEFKNNYCFANNIPIIRIPYTHLNELSLKDLLLETSKFILKKEAS